MTIKPTIIVIILAAIGLIAAYLTWRSDQTTVTPTVAQRQLFTTEQFAADSIQRITLERPGEPRLVFEKTGERWNQVQPFAFPMDPYSINQFIVQALALQVLDEVPTGEVSSLAALGLETPAAVVTFIRPDSTTTIQLGRRGVAGRAYLRLPDQGRVYMVGQGLHDRAVTMNPREWRSRKLFAEVSVDSLRIEREEGNHRFVIARQRRQWRMLEPAQTRLDDAARDEYIAALARVEAAGFILDQPADLEAFGLEQPVATLTVINSPATPQNEDSSNTGLDHHRLLIGSPVGVNAQERYAMIEGRPTILKLNAPTLAALFRRPEFFASLTAAGIDPADVGSIRIRANDADFTLERDIDAWSCPDRDNQPAAIAIVRELLAQLTSLRATSVSFERFPVDHQVGFIVLHGLDGQPIDTVRIARAADESWIMENGDDVLRAYPKAMKIPLAPADFGLR